MARMAGQGGLTSRRLAAVWMARSIDPCVISWPRGMKARGELRDQYHHAIDLVPTVLDVLGVEAPATIKGYVQSRLDG
jgi:arylsulfatase A-like enzyme